MTALSFGNPHDRAFFFPANSMPRGASNVALRNLRVRDGDPRAAAADTRSTKPREKLARAVCQEISLTTVPSPGIRRQWWTSVRTGDRTGYDEHSIFVGIRGLRETAAFLR